VTLRLDPGERRALGFAARAPPTDPPVEVAEAVAVDRAVAKGREERSESDGATTSATAAALRRLGDHRPPRDAVADETAARVEGGTNAGSGGPDRSDCHADADPADPSGPAVDDGDESDPGPAAHASPPEATTEWVDAAEERLRAVEERIDRAERLTDADLATATEAVAEVDGVEGLSGLDERVAADAKRLRELSDRASALATRAEATDAPVEALERLA